MSIIELFQLFEEEEEGEEEEEEEEEEGIIKTNFGNIFSFLAHLNQVYPI